MTERKAGAEIILKISRVFHKSKLKFFSFFSSIRQPKNVKLAAHEHKVYFNSEGLKNIHLVIPSL
jgi:hypothetical protein